MRKMQMMKKMLLGIALIAVVSFLVGFAMDKKTKPAKEKAKTEQCCKAEAKDDSKAETKECCKSAEKACTKQGACCSEKSDNKK